MPLPIPIPIPISTNTNTHINTQKSRNQRNDGFWGSPVSKSKSYKTKTGRNNSPEPLNFLFPSIYHTNSKMTRSVLIVFRLFSHDYPVVFLLFSYDFPSITRALRLFFPWITYGFPWLIHGWSIHHPCDIQMHYQWPFHSTIHGLSMQDSSIGAL